MGLMCVRVSCVRAAPPKINCVACYCYFSLFSLKLHVYKVLFSTKSNHL